MPIKLAGIAFSGECSFLDIDSKIMKLCGYDTAKKNTFIAYSVLFA